MRGPLDIELSITLDRGGAAPLHAQIESQLREAIRAGRLGAGTRLPSTRLLAGRLNVSRGVVVEAYAQLSAEGYLAPTVGSGTVVAGAARSAPADGRVAIQPYPVRWNFHPGLPDLASFPRAEWARSARRAISGAPDSALGYGSPAGSWTLRGVLADYLGRVRGAVADSTRIVLTGGHVQGFGCLCRVLRARGARTIALEDPGFFMHRDVARHWGLEPIGIPVDEDGLDVDALARTDARAVLVTPAHQSPTGAVLTPDRRRALLEWAVRIDGLVVEDDYDAEFRYQGEAVGCLQGLDPERVVYMGTVSKTLAPGLRIGWVLAPAALFADLEHEKRMEDFSGDSLAQLTLADFLERGELDRHLRRMRPRYAARRRVLGEAVARHLPAARLSPATAGLHVLAELPEEIDEAALLAAAARRGVFLQGAERSWLDKGAARTGLVLGFANQPESSIERGVAEVAAAMADV